MSQTVYLVGLNLDTHVHAWSMCGIFSSKRVATAVAIDISEDCFVAPIELDSMESAVFENQGEMNDSFYPSEMKKKELMK